MKILKAGWRDFVGSLVLLIFFGGVIALNFLQPQLEPTLPWMFL